MEVSNLTELFYKPCLLRFLLIFSRNLSFWYTEFLAIRYFDIRPCIISELKVQNRKFVKLWDNLVLFSASVRKMKDWLWTLAGVVTGPVSSLRRCLTTVQKNQQLPILKVTLCFNFCRLSVNRFLRRRSLNTDLEAAIINYRKPHSQQKQQATI